MKNREIKFRAWLTWGEKKMIDVKTIDWEDIGQFVTDETNTKHFFDQIELMQYTGLKDRNGKEIYEGDIVKIDDEEVCDYPEVFEISWMEDGACFFPTKNGKWNDNWDYNPFTKGTEDWEVIGNIYENPDLLSPNTKDK